MKNRLSILFLLLVIASCTNKGGEVFTKRTPKDSGITFENTLTDSKDLSILDYLYYYNGGGVAIGDINNDSLPDIFFSGNQVKNKLYLNKGNLEFEDISKSAGVEGNSSWNTGAVMGDINGDGLLDIYVCAVVGLNGFNGYNELYINQGNNTFMESAAQYGLDFESYSSSAAFLDYDLDGDLDIYLLNHAVHSQDSYGTASLRTKRTYETGDKLLRNDNGKFTDVSEEAGIYGGINGYGLGIAVSDFNQDGYPDLYIGNDFHEDDYYYLNNGDGTFKESLREYFGHTTRFSMGSDVADINHDGLTDLISLDMLAGDEKVLKSSDGDDDIQIHKLKTGKFGYYNQYTRNMLFINQPNGTFLETALLSGVAATDWSWSALFGDYDQDGEQDLYISNGIPKRPNNLDYINYISNENIKQKINNTNLVDQKALTLMPSGYVGNMVFKGAANLKFIDESQNWLEKDSIISGATAYGDLDNDGDLDLVTNNLNHPSLILENTTNAQRNWLKIKLSYQKGNNFGIGTKIYAYTNGVQQFKELYTVRGFQASSEPVVHFGFNTAEKIDSIKIVWPNKKYQTLKNIPVNQTLYIHPENTKTVPVKAKNGASLLFKKTTNNLGIDFVHIEDSYSDYLRQKLIPYQISDRGPAVSIGDLNGDGKDDIFFGGAKYVASQIYIQGDTLFQQKQFPKVKNDSIKEDISSLIADFNADGNNDLMIGTGGADFFGQMKPLTNSYYTNSGQTMVEAELPQLYENTAVLLKLDFDHDNDIDVWVGNQSITADYGNKPNSYLLENTNGSFSISNQNVFKNLGLVTDALIADFNNDGWEDIIVIGEWMSPKFFQNNNGIYTEVNVLDNDKINGLWQAITSFDIDADGDLDFLLGNWGTNTKFSATQEHPMRMYYGDLDLNGSTETVISTYKSGKNYPIDGLKELSSQLVFLRKKFTNYISFAGKSIEEVLGKEAIKNTEILEVHTLNSGFLRNDNGKFSFIPFNFELQTAPIMDFLEYDFDGDTKTEVLAAGNYFGVKPYHGRFDSFPGAMIAQGPAVSLTSGLGLDLTGKSIRNMQTITFKGHTYLLLTFNNEAAQVYQILKQ